MTRTEIIRSKEFLFNISLGKDEYMEVVKVLPQKGIIIIKVRPLTNDLIKTKMELVETMPLILEPGTKFRIILGDVWQIIEDKPCFRLGGFRFHGFDQISWSDARKGRFLFYDGFSIREQPVFSVEDQVYIGYLEFMNNHELGKQLKHRPKDLMTTINWHIRNHSDITENYLWLRAINYPYETMNFKGDKESTKKGSGLIFIGSEPHFILPSKPMNKVNLYRRLLDPIFGNDFQVKNLVEKLDMTKTPIDGPKDFITVNIELANGRLPIRLSQTYKDFKSPRGNANITKQKNISEQLAEILDLVDFQRYKGKVIPYGLEYKKTKKTILSKRDLEKAMNKDITKTLWDKVIRYFEIEANLNKEAWMSMKLKDYKLRYILWIVDNKKVARGNKLTPKKEYLHLLGLRGSEAELTTDELSTGKIVEFYRKQVIKLEGNPNSINAKLIKSLI